MHPDQNHISEWAGLVAGGPNYTFNYIHYGINSYGVTHDAERATGGAGVTNPTSIADVVPGRPELIKLPSQKVLLGEGSMTAALMRPYYICDGGMNGNAVNRHNKSGTILWCDSHASMEKDAERFNYTNSGTADQKQEAKNHMRRN